MDAGPGTKPKDYLYLDEKWGIRAVPANGRVFFYVDGPFDDEDDGSLNDVFPWERYLQKDRPNFMLGDYSGTPTCWEGYQVFKQSCPQDSPFVPFFYAAVFDQEPKPISEAFYFVGFHGTLSTHPCRQGLPAAIDYSRGYLRANEKVFWAYSESFL